MDDAKRLFAEGLSSGFAGKTNHGFTPRGSFRLANSTLDDGRQEYNDAWVIGGGQELIRTVDKQAYTRVYAGDVINAEGLFKLGIYEDQVIDFLASVLREHAISTRADENFELKPTDSDWAYSYEVIFHSEDPFVITGKETISYKGTNVFLHMHTLSKVREP